MTEQNTLDCSSYGIENSINVVDFKGAIKSLLTGENLYDSIDLSEMCHWAIVDYLIRLVRETPTATVCWD